MAETRWSLAVSSEPQEVLLGGARGQLDLHGCCLAGGEKATLFIQTADGPRLALGVATAEKPYCSVLARLREPVKVSCAGGKLLLGGLLLAGRSREDEDAEESAEPAAKRAKTAPATEASTPQTGKKAAAESPMSQAKEEESRRVSFSESVRKLKYDPAMSVAEMSQAIAKPAPKQEAKAEAGPAQRLAEDRTALRAAQAQAAAKRKAEAEAEVARAQAAAAAKAAAKPAAKAEAKAEAKAAPKAAPKPDDKPARVELKGGLVYDVLRPGKGGGVAKPGATVQVRYDGRLAKTGKRFDKGTIKFRLGRGEVIQGWDEGVKGMMRGEQRRLMIPARMGYGQRGAPPAIPKNADLVFEVELLQC